MSNRAKRLGTALGALVALSRSAAAHERWVRHELLRPFDRALFEGWNWTNGIVLLAILLLIGIGVAVRRETATRRSPESLSWRWCPVLLRVAYGLVLVMFARRGAYLAPDLVLDESLVEGRVFMASASALGLCLLLGAYVRLAAALTLLLFAWACLGDTFLPFDGIPIGPGDVLMNAEVVGIALYLAMSTVATGSSRELLLAQRNAGLGLLRCSFGATLVWLGLRKLMAPELFMGVVQNYPQFFYDPFSQLGLSEEMIVFGAIALEIGLGLAILTGSFMRTALALLAIVFTSTAVFFREEVLGHVVLVAIVVVLFAEGEGRLRDLRAIRALRARRSGAEAYRELTWARFGLHARRVVGLALVLGLVGFAFGDRFPTLDRGSRTLDSVRSQLVSVGELGRTRISVRIVPASFGVNEFFGIGVRVSDARTDEPLDGIDVVVDMIMPQHGHGMPTKPRTRWVDVGEFRTEGCKLNMHGSWLLSVEVKKNGMPFDRLTAEYVLASDGE